MRGSIYVIAEILIFMLAAAVIGYLIGRLTSRGGRPEPLKRLSGVEGSSARDEADMSEQAADLKRRLGIAYQTIRELEESNMRLRDSVAAEEGATDGEEAEAVVAAGPADAAEPDHAAQQDDVAGDAEEDQDAASETPEAESNDGSDEEPDPEAADETDPEAAVEAEADAEVSDAGPGDSGEGAQAMGPAERIKAAKTARDAAVAASASGAVSVEDAAAEIAAKDAEINRLKADLDRQMQQMGDLANRISELET